MSDVVSGCDSCLDTIHRIGDVIYEVMMNQNYQILCLFYKIDVAMTEDKQASFIMNYFWM